MVGGERIGFGLYQCYGSIGSDRRVSVWGCSGVVGVRGEWVEGLDQDMEGCGAMYVCVVSL